MCLLKDDFYKKKIDIENKKKIYIHCRKFNVEINKLIKQ